MESNRRRRALVLRRGLLVSASFLVACLPRSVHAIDWGLGCNLGLSNVTGEAAGSGTTTVLGLPGNAFGFQPGFRIGVATDSRKHELMLDTGLIVIDDGTSALHTFQGLVSYQYTLMGVRPISPFINGGLGILSEGGSGKTTDATTRGAGIGGCYTLGHRHGTLRAEGRIDHINRSTTTGRPTLNVWTLRLGFDLWVP